MIVACKDLQTRFNTDDIVLRTMVKALEEEPRPFVYRTRPSILQTAVAVATRDLLD